MPFFPFVSKRYLKTVYNDSSQNASPIKTLKYLKPQVYPCPRRIWCTTTIAMRGLGYGSPSSLSHLTDNYLTCQTISCMYLGILGTLAVNRSMLILYGSARLLPERVRSKHDLRPSLADLRPMFPQDGDLRRSSLRVGWPGGPGRSLILKQICSGLLKAPLLQGRGSLPPSNLKT